MANSRSARKRIRSNETKRVHNRTVRSAVRTKVAKARRTLLDVVEGADADQDLRAAVRALDRAAEKGVLHKNNVRRRKSRLTSLAARLTQAAQGAEGEKAAVRKAAVGGAKGRSTKASAARKPAETRTAKAAPKTPAVKATSKPAPAAKTAKRSRTSKP